MKPPRELPRAHIEGFNPPAPMLDYHVSSKVPVAGKTPKYKPVYDCKLRDDLPECGK